MKTLLACAGAALVVAVGASATAAAAQSNKDADFVRTAIKGDNSEIMLGGIAQRRGASDGVRSYGGMLVSDHSKAREDAQRVAEQLHVNPPSGAMAQADVERSKLMRLSGAAFDREFARYMVDDHQHDIADFEKEAAQGHGPAAMLAKQGLPVLHKHLEVAERLQAGGR